MTPREWAVEAAKMLGWMLLVLSLHAFPILAIGGAAWLEQSHQARALEKEAR